MSDNKRLTKKNVNNEKKTDLQTKFALMLTSAALNGNPSTRVGRCMFGEAQVIY